MIVLVEEKYHQPVKGGRHELVSYKVVACSEKAKALTAHAATLARLFHQANLSDFEVAGLDDGSMFVELKDGTKMAWKTKQIWQLA